MFYCTQCQKKNEWPESIMTSYGKCEMCDKVDNCNDFPSRLLPIPKPKQEFRLRLVEDD